MLTRVCFCVLFLLSIVVLAQTNSPAAKRVARAGPHSAYKLIAIEVTGTHHQADDVVGATGLQLGQTVREENFKAATEKLGETGLFTDITYRYSFSPAGTKLELQLADNSELVPVQFDNYVWSSDRELLEKLHSQVSLFEGKVPRAGHLLEQVAAALDALLAAHGPQFHARYLSVSAPEEGGPIQSVVFSVEGLPIRLRRVIYAPADASQLVALGAVAKKVEGGDYTRSQLRDFAQLEVRPIYLRQGYLRVTFGEAEPQLVSETGNQVEVDAKLPVEKGAQYKLAGITWSGNTAVGADKLEGLIHLPLSQPANAVQLGEDLEAIERLYGTYGYLRAKLHSQPEFNESERTVAYRVSITEGDLYRMGDLDLEGLDANAAARLRDDWQLRKGEPYDASYAKRFMHEAAADLPRGSDWKMAVHESVDDQDKTVDVTLRFTR